MTIVGPVELDPKAYWDSQLKFSSILPEFQTYLDRMAADSSAFSQGRSFNRLSTGPNPRQWVEWTEGSGLGRTIPILIHGGYWRALRAEDHRFMMVPFLETSVAVGSIEYRLKPAFSIRDIVEDVRAGIRAMAQQFPSEDFVLIGHSAGAHLSLWASKDPFLRHRIAGVLALSGVYDLQPVAASSLQKEIELTLEETVEYSLDPAETFPPVIYFNGSEETYEMVRESMRMATKGACKVVVLPNANHMTLTWAATDWFFETIKAPHDWELLFSKA